MRVVGWLRDRLHYGNVIATVALFIALGGVAYAIEANSVKSKHIAKNAVKGKDVKESSLRGIGGGILGGEVPRLDEDDSFGFNPLWGRDPGLPAADQSNTFLASRKFVATRLRVKLLEPFTAGNRTFTFSRNVGQPGAEVTALACTIEAPARTCRSNARVTYNEGDVVSAQVQSSIPATGGINASFGWVALTP